MGLFEFCQLSFNHLPLPLSYLVSVAPTAPSKSCPFGFRLLKAGVIGVIVFSDCFLEFDEVGVLFECNFLSLFCLFFGLLQFFLQSLEFFLEFSDGLLNILILVDV